MIKNREHLISLSNKYNINEEDILLIALNACGTKSDLPYARIRSRVVVCSRSEETFYINLALNGKNSPFYLDDQQILLNGEVVAKLTDLEEDDVVVGYFRKNGKVMTLNSNARSHCTGCVFCYTTTETSSDPRLLYTDDLDGYLKMVQAEMNWQDLSHLEEVTLSTGCFQLEKPAIDHLTMVRRAFEQYGFNGKMGFLSSVLRTDKAFTELNLRIAPLHYLVTIECFFNRDILLKHSKASLTFEQMPDLLRRSIAHGFETNFTYIVGLDPINISLEGLEILSKHVNRFPNFQVYQVHNEYMQAFANKNTITIDYFLNMRREIERIFRDTNLRPQSWENYRPLWYFTFGDEELRSIRI